MNVEVFKAVMRPILSANNVANRSVFAGIMAKAYECATVGFAGTTFGARLVSGDTAFLQRCINDALDANFTDKTRSTNRSAYILMAVGFMGYWATAKFTPTPIPGAMDVTVKGPVVKIPGSSDPLGANLFYSFVLGYTEPHLNSVCASLLAFQKTIAGTIEGTKGTAAVILPWNSII